MDRDEPTPTKAPQIAPKKDDSDREQIIERLSWTPKQRLRYLTDMLAFEERARHTQRFD